MQQSDQSGTVVFLRSNSVAPDPRVEKEAKALHEAGWKVFVVAWDRTAELADEKRDYADIFRVRVRAPYGARFRNIPRKLRWNFALLSWLISNRRLYSHVHACDLDTVLPAIIAKKLCGKKVIYDIFDNIILEPTAAYVKPEVSVKGKARRLVMRSIAGFIKCVENWAIKRADTVILVDESRKHLIDTTKPRRLEFIYNSPETPQRANESAEVVQPQGSLKIMYVGQMALERGLLEMLDMVAKRPDFELHMAGYGCDEKLIVSKAQNLPNVRWYGVIDYDKTLELSAQADALFATYDPALPIHKYSSANKLFEAMMLGKPIVVARDTGMDELVREHSLGKVVNYADINQLEQAFQEIKDMPLEERKELAERARALYKNRYSAEIMKSRLVKLYEQTLATGGRPEE